MMLNSSNNLRHLICFCATFLALTVAAQATLISEYVPGEGSDTDTTDYKWQASVNNTVDALGGGYSNYRWDMTGYDFHGDAGSSLPGINTSYSFEDGGASNSNDDSFGKDHYPLGGGLGNDAGASATFEIWVRPNRSNWSDLGDETLFESGGTQNGMQIHFKDEDSGAKLSFITRSGGKEPSNAATTDLDLTDADDNDLLGDFIQIVGVVDPDSASENMRMYVNGGTSSGGYKAVTDSYKYWQDGGDVAGLASYQTGVAGYPYGDDGPAHHFKGEIAILRLYDGAKSDSEVADLYNAVAIPEPSTMFLIPIVAIGLLRLVRRRKSVGIR